MSLCCPNTYFDQKNLTPIGELKNDHQNEQVSVEQIKEIQRCSDNVAFYFIISELKDAAKNLVKRENYADFTRKIMVRRKRNN